MSVSPTALARIQLLMASRCQYFRPLVIVGRGKASLSFCSHRNTVILVTPSIAADLAPLNHELGILRYSALLQHPAARSVARATPTLRHPRMLRRLCSP